MPASSAAPSPVTLIWGEDEFSVKRRARQVYQQWCEKATGWDQEIIDGSVNNSGDALRALAKLRDALQTLPFFGQQKSVWFQNCNFLGDERAAAAKSVTEALTDLAQEWRSFVWGNVRLLISAGKVDKRRTFYKTIENMGEVEAFPSWSLEDRDWSAKAENWASRELQALSKTISAEALAELVASVGPHIRLLGNEIEKLALYVGDRSEIEVADVHAIVTRNKQAQAFALGDALGDRDLPRVLRVLDDELWSLKFDPQKSAIGLLYGLISKVRVLILLKEMLRAGWIKPEANWSRFQRQLEQLPADLLPDDKRLNPLAMHPYVLFKALPQAARFKLPELVRAMDLLLQCNQRLIFSGLDESLVLQQTLVQILN